RPRPCLASARTASTPASASASGTPAGRPERGTAETRLAVARSTASTTSMTHDGIETRARRPAGRAAYDTRAMRRAVLIANANAHTVTPYAQGVIARALAAGTHLEVVETKRQGHATHVASGAAHEGVDLVVVLGG